MAYDFVPGTDEESLDAGDVLDTSPDFTVAAIIQPDTVAARGMIVSKWDQVGTNRGFLFEVNSDATLRAFISTDGTFQGGNTVSSTGTLASDGTWYRVMFVMDGTNTDMRIYIDGSADGANTSGPATVYSNAARFLIGAEDIDTGTTNEFDGRIAGLAHWDRALTAAEAATFGATGNALFIPNGLDAYWPLIRTKQDVIGSNALSDVGTPVAADHPRIIYPAAQILQFPATAAAPGGANTLTLLGVG